MSVIRVKQTKRPIGKSTAFHNLGATQPPRIANTPIVRNGTVMIIQPLAP